MNSRNIGKSLFEQRVSGRNTRLSISNSIHHQLRYCLTFQAERHVAQLLWKPRLKVWPRLQQPAGEYWMKSIFTMSSCPFVSRHLWINDRIAR